MQKGRGPCERASQQGRLRHEHKPEQRERKSFTSPWCPVRMAESCQVAVEGAAEEAMEDMMFLVCKSVVPAGLGLF